jgi:threonine dehydrogenase-like Zn-dependent dehydrogenase
MSELSARAFWVTGPREAELRSEPLAAPASGELLIRTLYTGISRGTEALVYSNRVPESEYERMRAPFQDGTFPFPVKYGYSNVGTIESDSGRGRTVFCLYPHQDRYVVGADAVYALPDGVPAGRAVLAANLETAVNAVWDVPPRAGERVAIVGAGTVGCLVAWLAARVPGTEVELVDVNPGKARIAAALGVGFRAPSEATSEADRVFHASGSADGLATALALAAFEATVAELSWYGSGTVPVALGAAFHSRRLTLRASQVGAVATAQRARWSARRRMELVLRLLTDSALDALVTGESPFDELPATMRRLAAGPGDALCHRISYA